MGPESVHGITVTQYDALLSINRHINDYDNVHVESFSSHFKVEIHYGGSFPSLAESKLEISCHVA